MEFENNFSGLSATEEDGDLNRGSELSAGPEESFGSLDGTTELHEVVEYSDSAYENASGEEDAKKTDTEDLDRLRSEISAMRGVGVREIKPTDIGVYDFSEHHGHIRGLHDNIYNHDSGTVELDETIAETLNTSPSSDNKPIKLRPDDGSSKEERFGSIYSGASEREVGDTQSF